MSIEYHYLVLLEAMELPPKSVMDQLARENRGPQMMAASFALTVLAGAAVGLRVIAQRMVVRSLVLDDYAIVLGLVGPLGIENVTIRVKG